MISRVLGCALAVLALTQGASGRSLDSAGNEDEYRTILNSRMVTLLAGDASGASVRMADNIATAISGVEDVQLRIMLGDNVENVRDVLYMGNVDMAIINTDALAAFEDGPFFGNVRKRLRYVARLHNEEFHILGGPSIASVKDLDGKVVAFHNEASRSSGGLLLAALGVDPRESIVLDMFDAADRIKAGTVDGFIRLTGKPDRHFSRVKEINPEIRFVPVSFDRTLLEKGYLPTDLSSADYPDMFGKVGYVDTVALGTVLAVYNWPENTGRYKRLEKFVNAFFSNFEKLRRSKGHHPKWDGINIAGEMPGWTRFKPAQEWLDRARNTRRTAVIEGDLRKEFDRYLAEEHGGVALEDAKAQEKIFEEFLRWQARSRTE